jgi:orotate phosphoribosyltransferase
MNHKQQLITLLKEKSVKTGLFTLASGKQSDFYVDARQTILNAKGALLVSELILELVDPTVKGVGGPVTGADPIAGAVALLSAQRGRNLHGFMVRKEPKGHGANNWVEGRENLPKGSRLCVIEDTVTTGGSLLRAVQKLEDIGYTIAQCIAVVDREEGARKRIENAGYQYLTLTTKSELI